MEVPCDEELCSTALENDECEGAIFVKSGFHVFDTTEATTGPPLDDFANCNPTDPMVRKDVWYAIDIPDFSFETSNNNLSQSLEFLSFISSLPSCKKILVSGSCWELSQTQGKPSSGHQVKRVKDFIWAKNSLLSWLEKECLEKSIKLSWFRIFYVYGPRQREESLIPSILKSLKLGRFPEIKSPYASNDYIFVKDVVSAFLLAISKDAVSGIYNLGSGKFSSVIEICRLSELLVLGSDKFTKNLKENLKLEKKTPNYLADITKTTHTFGWEPKVSLEKGIEETWQFMSS